MLAITAKARLLKTEILSAKSVIRDIIGSLKGVDDYSDVRKEIGIFARQMPDWKIMAAEKEQLKDLIRKVCTGETSTIEAEGKLVRALEELDKLDAWIQVPLR